MLKVRYVEHAEHLRSANMFDLKVFSSFMGVQLVLGGWFAEHQQAGVVPRTGVLAIDLALLIVAVAIIRSSRLRREEVVTTIRNINRAWGLYDCGVYLPDRAIDNERQIARFRWYDRGCYLGWLGFAIVLFSDQITEWLF